MIVKTTTEVYLDANATTQVLPAAAKAASDAMEDLYGNPSSSHVSGLRARNILESTRELACKVLGADSGQVVFTSGATEAIQMAVLSALCHAKELRAAGERSADGRVLMYGATEHKAVPQAIRHWNKLLDVGAEVLEIPVDSNGMLDLDFIEKHAVNADMICTMAVNNETGVIADLAAIEERIRRVNTEASWLVDCVQAIGKTQLNLAETTIDYAALSGHKRGGTENLPGVAAIGAVLEVLANSPTRSFADEKLLQGYRDQLVGALKKAFPSIVFNTPFDHAVACTINFAVLGFPSKELLDLFDAAGVRVSSGSACGSEAQNSYVLDAMGLESWRSAGAIRLSFGANVTESEIAMACQRIMQVGQALTDSCLVISGDADNLSGQDLDGLIQLKNGSNCTWLLMDSKSRHCIVIDPFEEMAHRVETLLRCQDSKVIAVLDTHAHVDHDSCRKELLGAVSELLVDSAKTKDLLGWPESVDGNCELGDGTTAEWVRFSDDLVIAKTEFPGHTEIGFAYFVGTLDGDRLSAENVLFAFTGDMLLMGGIGRTDFPCSNIEKMYESLQRFPELITNSTLVCPTHDYNNEFATTLQSELATNEFLGSIIDTTPPISLEDFVAAKPVIDKEIADESNSELVCGLIRASDGSSCTRLLCREELMKLAGTEALIIDVREPHEFVFEQDWHELGFSEPPRNVPLTRFCNFLPELLKEVGDSERKVVFLCRSGRRSVVAAQVARRLGIKNAVSECEAEYMI